MANDGKRCHIICMILNANYCFLVVKHSSHNRLVAGSNPAGATKFSDVNHAVKPPFRVAFLFERYAVGSKVAADFYLPQQKTRLSGSVFSKITSTESLVMYDQDGAEQVLPYPDS